MTGPNKSPRKAESVPPAQTRQIHVKLKEVKISEDPFYCHRNKEELTRANLKELMDSLRHEGLQTAPEVYKDDDGAYMLLKGHRRITSLRLLAEDGLPSFSLDMEISVIEVLNTTPQDRLVRSLDNELHKSLSKPERIKAIKRLDDAGVPAERAASAFGIQLKTYERMLKIARHPWMYDHVERNEIKLTYAFLLLDAAEKARRGQELQEDLKAWVERTKALIQREEAARKQGGGEMRPSEKLVKKCCPRHLLDHWLDQIKKGQRFDEAAEWKFQAVVEKKTGRLRIGAVTINLKDAPLSYLVELAGKFSLVAKLTLAMLRKRRALEGSEGPQALLDAIDSPYDLDVFRENDMADVVEKLKGMIEPMDASSQDPFDDPDDDDDDDDESDEMEE